MSKTSWGLGAVLLLLTAIASAHTHLKSAVPAEGSTVAAAGEITLNFSEAARVTAIAIQQEGEAERKLTPPAAAAEHVTVSTGKLAPGKYTVTWRMLSGDKHVTSGKLHFTVSG